MLLCLLSLAGFSQQDSIGRKNCAITFKGRAYTTAHDSLPYATVQIKEINKSDVTDEQGNFLITNICKGTYIVECDYLGYKTVIKRITFNKNISYDFLMSTEEVQSQEVVINDVKTKEEKKELISQPLAELKGKELDRTRGLSLGESLKSIPGVNSIQTGPSISKPVIHGVHSNRILILNNGVRQEGQQWGSEHAPEIDPFIATKISVIKGAASVRYGSDAIGGVILVEPKALPSVPGIKGELNLVGMSNSRLGASSGVIEGAFGKKLSGLSWRLQGTVRRAANSKTSAYYMENTGFMEENFSSALAYNKEMYGAEFYFSRFDTKLGVFTGSQVDSIADLQQALQNSRPTTPSYFTYKINGPYQKVSHNLFKAKAFWKFKEAGKVEFIFARQQNKRYEYDQIPLNGSTDPALYLQIITHTTDLTWYHKSSKRISGNIGLNGITQGNVRAFEFLIPNFRNYGAGIFIIEKWKKGGLTIEAGGRYDYRWLRAYMPDSNTAQVITPTYQFNNFTGTLGALYYLRENLIFTSNFGTAWRSPNVSELLSDGVHQSAASYDIGNPNLKSERAYNLNAAVNYSGKKISGELGFYNNQINNYIYSKPDLQFIQTVRGAFPLFSYTQVNARFRGVDVLASYKITDSLIFTSKAAMIWAYNQSIHDYLVFTPANRFENSLKYHVGSLRKIKNIYFNVTNIYVAHQKRLPPNSDYTNPPAAYTLFNADLGFDLPLRRQVVNVNFSATNIFNVSYRDYLNRFRYFTDDVGRNFIVRLKIPFSILERKSFNENNVRQ
jgi:iron complex outermembrane recepter protein